MLCLQAYVTALLVVVLEDPHCLFCCEYALHLFYPPPFCEPNREVSVL